MLCVPHDHRSVQKFYAMAIGVSLFYVWMLDVALLYYDLLFLPDEKEEEGQF
jgi:hypothetical protein